MGKKTLYSTRHKAWRHGNKLMPALILIREHSKQGRTFGYHDIMRRET